MSPVLQVSLPKLSRRQSLPFDIDVGGFARRAHVCSLLLHEMTLLGFTKLSDSQPLLLLSTHLHLHHTLTGLHVHVIRPSNVTVIIVAVVDRLVEVVGMHRYSNADRGHTDDGLEAAQSMWERAMGWYAVRMSIYCAETRWSPDRPTPRWDP